MSARLIRLAVGALSATAIVLGALIASGALTARGGKSDIELPGISEEQLGPLGIKLLKPNGEPSIAAEQAVATALDKASNGEVQSTTLVRLVNDSSEPRLDTLAWAVSLDPASVTRINLGGPVIPDELKTTTPVLSATPPHCGLRPSYDVVFIDAITGEFIFEVQRGGKYQTLAPGETCPPTPVWTPAPVTQSPSP